MDPNIDSSSLDISGKRGVLLVNLGSPDSPDEGDVRRYLGEFLMDRHVLDLPYLVRRLVVSLAILPTRPKQSARAYAEIWWEQGSPLVVIGERVRELLSRELDIPVSLGMRYGNPSIEAGLQQLASRSDNPLDEVLLVPLFPHYAMSTYETILHTARAARYSLGGGFRLQVFPPFYESPEYIGALVASANPVLSQGFDHLLFSYHGLPERHLRKTDPTGAHCLQREHCCTTPSPAHSTCYRHQVLRTTSAFVNEANIPEGKYSVSFQSRLGRDPWLRPHTETEIVRLAEAGVKTLMVICPAFVADCLETLEEIGLRGREIFLAAGGETFSLVPCLNDHPRWIGVLRDWCR